MPSRSDKEKENSGEDFEVLDVGSEDAESLLRYIKEFINQDSNPKQLAIGGTSGWYFI